MKVKKELLDAFMKLSTPTVSDAMDKLGIRGGCEGLMPVVPGKKFVGPAFTVKFIPVGTVKTKAGDFIDEAEEGDVIVIDNAGRTWCTVWGDILTYVAVKKKLAGTVIDGVCRDVDGIRELGYPMYTKGNFMVTGKDRVTMETMNQPISICDIQVKPGDLIMCDQSGVLIIPLDKAEQILKTAVIIEKTEEKIIQEVKNGSKLIEARQKLKYDTLQRPEE
jgi:regulator of RNase E activity RraA